MKKWTIKETKLFFLTGIVPKDKPIIYFSCASCSLGLPISAHKKEHMENYKRSLSYETIR